jgi:molybdopterin synthase catalytic subunit
MNEEPVAARESVWIDVTEKTIDPQALSEFVADPRAGSTVLFSGTVRDHSPGRTGVSRLEYEAYGEMASAKIAEIVDEACAEWSILRVAAVHRVGSLDVGEPAVTVAVSSAHRSDGFDACRYIIDELKSRVPIWKKEHWPGGAEWVAEHDTRHTTDD